MAYGVRCILFHEKILQIDSTKNGYQIKVKIPYLNTTTLKLDKFGDELIINLDNKRKNFSYPNLFISIPYLHLPTQLHG